MYVVCTILLLICRKPKRMSDQQATADEAQRKQKRRCNRKWASVPHLKMDHRCLQRNCNADASLPSSHSKIITTDLHTQSVQDQVLCGRLCSLKNANSLRPPQKDSAADAPMHAKCYQRRFGK